MRASQLIKACILLSLGMFAISFMRGKIGVAGQSHTVQVSIFEYGFKPAKLNITTGTTVVWNNTGGQAHTSTDNESNPYWDSGDISSGGTFSKFFGNPGIYHYYCVIHPIMLGYVNVTGPIVQPPQSEPSLPILILVGVIVVALLGGTVIYLRRRSATEPNRRRNEKQPRTRGSS